MESKQPCPLLERYLVHKGNNDYCALYKSYRTMYNVLPLFMFVRVSILSAINARKTKHFW